MRIAAEILFIWIGGLLAAIVIKALQFPGLPPTIWLLCVIALYCFVSSLCWILLRFRSVRSRQHVRIDTANETISFSGFLHCDPWWRPRTRNFILSFSEIPWVNISRGPFGLVALLSGPYGTIRVPLGANAFDPDLGEFFRSIAGENGQSRWSMSGVRIGLVLGGLIGILMWVVLWIAVRP